MKIMIRMLLDGFGFVNEKKHLSTAAGSRCHVRVAFVPSSTSG
jgi:hypothetical protein